MKRQMVYLFPLVLMLALAIGGCAKKAQAPMTAKDLVAEAKHNVCEKSVSESKVLFDEGGYVFLDCREPKEYKMGHIPGAVNIPRGVLEFNVANKIPEKDTKIVMYCKKGSRGCLAACTLSKMGYRNVLNMDGGWLAWEKAGYPVE
jgi:rhodanese-related sulfurtransferase